MQQPLPSISVLQKNRHLQNMTTCYLWINLFFLVLSQSLVLEAQLLSEAAPFMLFGLRQHISRFQLDGSNIIHYLSNDDGVTGVVGIDIDIRAGRIFWSDVMTKQLCQADIDQTSITNVHQLLLENASMIDGVAWDWVNHKLYWTTVGSPTVDSTIEVMDTDNCYRKVLARYNDGTKARAIVLDPINGWIFWSDYNRHTSKIVRMSMDGTNSTVLVTMDNLMFPNGLSLDYATQTLFWIDAGTDEIGSIGIDGTRRRVIAYLKNYYHLPHPFALEFYGGQLYFGDWKEDSIRKLTSLTSDQNVAKVQNFSFDPTTIRVIHLDRQPSRPGGNPCSVNNGGCTHLCLLSATPSGYSCAKPDSSLACTTPSPSPNTKPNTTPNTTPSSSPDTTRIGNDDRDCTTQASGIRGPGEIVHENFSVSGTLFLGVVGALLVVIVMMTAIIAVIVYTSVRSSNGKRSHSIGGLSDSSPRDSPTHEAAGRLSDHNYISIKSRESPAPRTIVINIESVGNSPTFDQFSTEKNHHTNSNGMNALILTPKQSCIITNETDHVINENHSNNNPVNATKVITLENSGATPVKLDSYRC